MRNKCKFGKRLCSLLLILVMIIVILPVSLSADEGGEETETQVTTEAETESETSTESEAESSTQSGSELSESTEAPEESEAQAQNNTGSISGTIWLDENQDGVYGSSEKPVVDYEVSLYLSTNTNDTVASVTTDSSGKYTFTDLVPDDYVVGIPLSQEVDGTEYLVPLIGISCDNKFALDETTYDAYTNTISIAADSEAKDYNAGVRLPLTMQTLSVGIQPGSTSSTAYTPNTTVIGFAGYEWWVIGNSSSGVTSPSANSVTLWAKNNNFGTTLFRPVIATTTNRNKYIDSILQTEMNNLNTTLFTTTIGNTQESNYVVNRTSIDLIGYYYYSGTVATVATTDTYGYGTTSGNFWPLSRGEWGTVYDTGSTANIAVCTLSGANYWLRSPVPSQINYVWFGGAMGNATSTTNLTAGPSLAVRPAFYLNLSSVIFTSAASGTSIKSATTGSTLQDVSTTWTGSGSTQPIKLTMEDNTNLGTINLGTTTVVTAPPGGTAEFTYSGAKTGTRKSVSILICDQTTGEMLYYGRPVDTSSTNASGTASFTVPSSLAVGDYTLKVFNEQVNGNNYTDYASTPQAITLRVAEVKVGVTANPTTKVYNGTVDLTAVVGNTFGGTSTIEDVDWFRVPVHDTTDYSSSFTTGYNNATAGIDRGTLSDPGTSETTQTFNNLTVNKNAIYWFKGTVKDSTNTYTGVGSITVDNIYTTTPVSVRGETSDAIPIELYGYEVVNGIYGIPYDLDSTTAAPTVLASPSLGFDSVTIDAKNQYSTHWTSTMKSNTALSLTLTLNSAFLSNMECDSGDYTKYTIVYSRIPSVWQTITAHFVDESGSALTSTGGFTYETFSAPVGASGDVINFLGDGGVYTPPTVTAYTAIGYRVGSTLGAFVSCTDFTTFDPLIPVTSSGITDVYIVYRASTTDLAIDKTVNGQYSDPNQNFAITITLMDSSSVAVSGNYAYTITDSGGSTPITGTITFNASGQKTIDLKHDQTITITGITQGYTYSVQETDTFVTNGTYTPTYSSPTGTVSGTGVTGTFGSATEEVSIINSRTPVVVTGLSGSDYHVAAVSFLAVLAVAVTTIWYSRSRKKCK